jgi:hypothetical protein
MKATIRTIATRVWTRPKFRASRDTSSAAIGAARMKRMRTIHPSMGTLES